LLLLRHRHHHPSASLGGTSSVFCVGASTSSIS
jgi:hypothetical protein